MSTAAACALPSCGGRGLQLGKWPRHPAGHCAVPSVPASRSHCGVMVVYAQPRGHCADASVALSRSQIGVHTSTAGVKVQPEKHQLSDCSGAAPKLSSHCGNAVPGGTHDPLHSTIPTVPHWKSAPAHEGSALRPLQVATPRQTARVPWIGSAVPVHDSGIVVAVPWHEPSSNCNWWSS